MAEAGAAAEQAQKPASEVEADKDYDAAWEEADKAEPAPKDDKPKGDEPAADSPDKNAPEAAAAETPAADAPAKDAPAGVAPEQKPLAGIEKALHDTKAYATTLAQENAKLRKALADGQSAAKVEAAKESQKKAEDALKFSLEEAYKDYPELKGALDQITTELKSVKEKLNAREEADEKVRLARESQDAEIKDFEANVKPAVLEVHADFDSIVKDPKGEFFKWAETQSPAIKTAVFDSSNAQDIVWALTEYKKAKASGEVDKLHDKDDKTRTNNLNLAHGLKSGSSKIPSGKDDKNFDPDREWDNAGKLLEKQGVR